MDLSSPKIPMLNGGNKKNTPKLNIDGNVFGGQTPTPTKLIENCEKFGIFDDLNKVNPFEEVFRQAVEYKTVDPINKDALHHNEDSLHTPQVLGLKENVQLIEQKITQPKLPTPKRKKVKHRSILPNSSKPLIVSNGILITQPQIISITTYPQKITSALQSHPIKEKLKQMITSKQNDDHKERSKAASLRYRQKSKLEHVELKRKYKSLLIENLELKNRITELENIVSRQSSSGQSTIHIEPSTVRFEMNIPKMVIFPNHK